MLMRIPVYRKSFLSFLCLVILILLMVCFVSSSLVAQNEQGLLIEIYDSNDWNKPIETTLIEGRSYDIAVSTQNDSAILGVNITMLGTSYNTSIEQPFITITAPSFEDAEAFNITATKEGYLPTELDVIIIKGELSAVCQPNTVEEKKNVEITVTDQDHVPVENALVYLTDESEPIPTDARGTASLSAPEVSTDTSLNVQIIKRGYLPTSLTLRVDNIQGVILALSYADLLQIIPLLIAVLVVIFAIVIVSWRKKKQSTSLHPQTHVRQKDQAHSYSPGKQTETVHTESALYSINGKKDTPHVTSNSRVEEIRIPVQAKKRETTLLTEEKEEPKPSVNQKIQDDEWFKGQDYIRYKLDELTGQIDKNTDGKWFEGERDIRSKVDEALKKNVKKKKDEDPLVK
jgi:uncharacterized protein YpmB